MALKREQVVQTAEKYVARGKIEPAIREYRKLLAENPNDINTLNRVGDLYARIQRFDEAVDFFTQIAERYSVEGFFVKAIAIYKKIIKLNPTLLEVYEALASLYAKQGLITEARTQYLVLADYYQKHDNAASAIGIYNELVALEPENPSHHVKLAEIYRQQKLFEKALGEYRTIAELMIDVGHLQEASQVYERALDLEAAGPSFLSDAVTRLRRAKGDAVAARLLAVASERNPQLERAARELAEAPAAAPAPAATLPPPLAAPPSPASRAAEKPPEVSPDATPFALDVDLDLDEDLYDVASAAEHEVDLAPQAPPISARAPEPPRAARQAAPEPEEIELDLDDVFVLEIEDDDDEPPASLVKPPPDLLDEGPGRRPIWSQTASGVTPAPSQAPQAVPPPAAAPPPVAAAPPAAAPPLAAAPSWRDLGEIDLSDLPPLEPLYDPFADLPEVAFDDFEEPTHRPVQPVAFDPEVLERTAAEINTPPPERDEDLVTEAEVLARYGLEEKALERLRDALRLNPRHLGAYALLIQLHADHHRTARVVETANQMARIAHEVGSPEAWAKVKAKLVGSGYRIEGDRVVAPPAARGARDQGVDQLLRGLLDEKPKRPKAPAAPVTPAADIAKPKPPTPPTPSPTPPVAAVPPAVAPIVAPSAPPQAMTPPSAPVAPTPPPLAAMPTMPPPALFDPRGIADSLLDEDDDFVVPGMRAEAPPLPAPPSRLESKPPTPPPPAPASLDDTGMSWLDEAEKVRPTSKARGDGLFAEDDFFDLAGELEQELEREVPFSAGELLVQPTEQTLEEIVEGFKKGVAENLSPTDFDTHYNLGIAYREMGLVDEAIGEFQLAAKDGAYLVSCCSMLGLCFLEKGLPELAIKWYRRGLEAPGVSEEDGLGLLYDLGNAHAAAGDAEGAYKSFVDLYGINSNYRDVVAKLEELGHSR